MFNFPEEFHVVINQSNIEVDIQKLTGKDKDMMAKWELQPKNKIVIVNKNRTKCTKIIKGGNEELRIKFLIYLLEKLGLYTIPPPPAWDPVFLQNFDRSIAPDESQESLNAKLKLEDFIYANVPNTPPNVSSLKFCPVNVGVCTTSYLLYYFARPEDYSKFDKTFSDANEPPFVVQMKLPIPVWVSVCHNVDKNSYTFSFCDVGKIRASVFKCFLLKLAKNMENDYAKKMTVENGEFVEMKYVAPIAEKYGLYVAAYQDYKTVEEELARSFIYVFSKKGVEDKDKVDIALKEMFETVKLYYCLKCKSVYPITNTVCFEYYHKGKRIPFPDGEMEIVDCDEVDEYDEPVTLYNWSCCGELPDYEPGCMRKPNGAHQPDKNHKEITKYKIAPTKYFMKF